MYGPELSICDANGMFKYAFGVRKSLKVVFNECRRLDVAP